MNYYLTESRLAKNCFILSKDVHHIYKLIVKKTGHYYIGVSKNFEKRVDQHCTQVMSAVTGNGILFYPKIASILTINYESMTGIQLEKEIRNSLDIQVLAAIVGIKPSFYLEDYLIRECNGDLHCLNFNT